MCRGRTRTFRCHIDTFRFHIHTVEPGTGRADSVLARPPHVRVRLGRDFGRRGPYGALGVEISTRACPYAKIFSAL